MKNISELSSLEEVNGIIILNNIKLLDKPIIEDNTTILKIICDKNLKFYLKKIEKLLENSINFNINFDLESKNDYYNLVINKKINKIVNQLNINNFYNIGVRLLLEQHMWILESIEIEDEDIDEDIVDYHELKEDLLLKLNIKINNIETESNKLNSNLNKLSDLKKELSENFNKQEIENYYNLIN